MVSVLIQYPAYSINIESLRMEDVKKLEKAFKKRTIFHCASAGKSVTAHMKECICIVYTKLLDEEIVRIKDADGNTI